MPPRGLPFCLAACGAALLFLGCREPPVPGTDFLQWSEVGERTFAVEAPSATAAPFPAVHEWRVLIAFAAAPAPAEEPQYTFIPPGSSGAVITLPHTATYGDGQASFLKTQPAEYELWIVYPPTGPENIDRIGFPDATSRWKVGLKHPNAASGGSYGSVAVTVRHREVASEPASAWLTGKVLLCDQNL